MCLGSFESLPPKVQEAIRQAIVDDDRWRLAGKELGDWHFGITRSLERLGRYLSQHRLKYLAYLIWLVAGIIGEGPAMILYGMHQRRLGWQGKFGQQPTLAALLHSAGIEPWSLAAGYARKIPQPDAYRAFWHDASHHHTVGVVLGIDFAPTPAGYWYLESNLNPALRFERTRLYDRDPFVANLLDFAEAQGYRRMVVMAGVGRRIDELMARQYEEGALARGIELDIVEDPFLPSSRYTQSFSLPSLGSGPTLVVRKRSYPTNLDCLFNHKWASVRALEAYGKASPDPDLLLPPTGAEPVPGEAGTDDPFPNLVYKFPDLDFGESVFFLKARSAAHARAILDEEGARPQRRHRLKSLLSALITRQKGLYQSYIRSPLLPGRRLHIVRSHALLTPVAIEFLSAHRVVSRHSVPERLPFGAVRNPGPYIVNYSMGSRYEALPPGEEPAVKKATLAVARALGWAAAYGFQTG